MKIRIKSKKTGDNSNNQMYLSVKSKFIEKYKLACSLMTELIINVFEEYKRFCERRILPINCDLVIKKEESFTPRK